MSALNGGDGYKHGMCWDLEGHTFSRSSTHDAYALTIGEAKICGGFYFGAVMVRGVGYCSETIILPFRSADGCGLSFFEAELQVDPGRSC